MHDCELAAIPQRLERRHPRMQAKVPIEIDRAVRRAGLRDCDRRACAVIVSVAERHDHIEAVHGAALEDHDQQFSPIR